MFDMTALMLRKGVRCVESVWEMTTYYMPGSISAQRPLSLPASMSSKPPPNLDKLKSVSDLGTVCEVFTPYHP